MKKHTPYAYLVVFTDPVTKIESYYYGVQYGRRAHPDNLWNTYFTSSKTVRRLIKKYGTDCFRTEVRRTFQTEEECKRWEHKVLTRMRVVEKTEWLNRNDSYGPPHMVGEEHPCYGKPKSEITKYRISKRAKERFQNQTYYNKMVEAFKKRDLKAYWTEERRQNHAELIKTEYQTGKRQARPLQNEFNPMFNKKHTEESKKKMSAKAKGRPSCMKGKQHTEESKNNMSAAKKGCVWMYKDKRIIMVTDSEEIKRRQKDGFLIGRPKLEKRVYVHNHQGVTKRIPASKFMEYIATGDWFEGKRPSLRRIRMLDQNGKEHFVSGHHHDKYAKQGWTLRTTDARYDPYKYRR